MKIKSNQKFSSVSLRHSSGMTLLDVLLGIVIFVVGMLALASLQGNLTRSTADANARTVGTNIAEEIIEQLRTFEKIRTEVGFTAYQDIVDDTLSFERAGNTYTVNIDVQDFYFDEDAVSFTDDTDELPDSWDTTISNFKYVELDVSWTGNEFVISEGKETTGRLGSGAFTISGIIPSTPQLGSAKVASEDDGKPGTPPIDYTPGARPDIVAINLEDSKFKESSTPLPEVIRTEELVETWFDVVTYNTTGDDSIYLRREEFVVLSCECSLNDNPGGGDGSGFLPTIWNGETYTEGEWVDKAWGEPANNQQSSYCDTCCRDHHDSPSHTGSHEVYDPARLINPAIPEVWSQSGGLDGDHKHFTRARRGGLSLAVNNQGYVEACRMVRKDGFMRVAQDFRQEGLVSFPQGYLDTEGGVADYSDYVTKAVKAFYAGGGDQLDPPSDFGIDFPADKIDAAGADNDLDTTALPLLGLNSQQMRSRGIYVDAIGPELADFLDCIADVDCESPAGVTGALQVLPFYDIQTTFLAAWDSDPMGTPVSVTSETVTNDNGHSRGLAVLEDTTATGPQVEVATDMHRGNIGLTVSDPITELDDNLTSFLAHELFIDLNGGGGDPDPVGYTWSGIFGSAVNNVDAADATITEGGNTYCARSGTSLSCVTPLDQAGSITITGYTWKRGQNWMNYWICVSNFPTATVVNTPDGANNSATISWPANPNPVPANVILSIESSACL